MRLLNILSLQRLSKEQTYPINMEGQINFRRTNDEKFQKRYFLLKGNLLYYFAKKSDRTPYGLIILEGYTVELSNVEDGYCFQLLRRRSNSGQVAAALTFVVGTGEALQNWLIALTNCSYERLKISAERIDELAKIDENNQKTGETTTAETIRDENDNQLARRNGEPASSDIVEPIPKASFEELHEIYGHKIKAVIEASKIE